MTPKKFLNLISGLAILLVTLVFSSRLVYAHASLVRSSPALGEVLAQAPAEVELVFSESVDPEYFSATLLDADSQVIVSGPGALDASSPEVLRLALPPLPDGVYTVSWKVRSAVDGHITNGLVNFSVGLDSPAASLLPPPGTPDPATALPSLVETVARWVSYLFAALAVGSLSFAWLIWRAVVIDQGQVDVAWGWEVEKVLRRLALAGVFGAALGTTGLVLVQFTQTAQISPDQPKTLLSFLNGRVGFLFGSRLLLLGLMGWLIRGHQREDIAPPKGWLYATGLAPAAMFTFSLQSHSAALESSLAVVMDWLHLVAMSVWVGGLAPLAILLVLARRRDKGLVIFGKLIPRFSRLALVSVTVIAITGLYMAYVQVQTLEALLNTSYGWSLLGKSGLFVLLMVLGAVNLLVLSPRLSRSLSGAVKWLSRTVRTEIALGVLVLIAAGVMTGVSPAFDALQAQRRQGFSQETRLAQGVDLKLYVAPARVGENELGVDIRDSREPAAQTDEDVLMRFTPPDPDLGTFQAEATPSDGERFSVRGAYLSMTGTWQIEVILRQAGMDDARHVFEVPVEALPAEISASANPVTADPDSIAQGRDLFQQNCQPCHGSEGKGDGPVGRTLNPPPPDLSEHTVPGLHPDEQLFEWISEGYPGSVMPAFEDTLSEEERWHLVNFIRTFAQ
jgi:copper transport protein